MAGGFSILGNDIKILKADSITPTNDRADAIRDDLEFLVGSTTENKMVKGLLSSSDSSITLALNESGGDYFIDVTTTNTVGQVDSVSGTADRIEITGTATDPIVNIASTYVGQASITTVGTIATGTWNADVINEIYGGTGQNTYATGDLLYSSAPNTIAKRSVGTNGQVLRVVAGVPDWDDEQNVTVPSQTLSFKASDFDVPETNFAELSQVNGSNKKIIVRSFDDTTEEFVNFSIDVPGGINTAGTVLFKAYVYAETAVADRFAQLRFGHSAINDNESWDVTYTNVDSGDTEISSTQDNVTIIEWNETVSNLGWASDDTVLSRLSRIATSGTNLAGDLQLISLSVGIPRA